MSEKCQQETHAPDKMMFLFNHLVGERFLAERLESCRATVLWRDSKH
jgi:hypothetical protein